MKWSLLSVVIVGVFYVSSQGAMVQEKTDKKRDESSSVYMEINPFMHNQRAGTSDQMNKIIENKQSADALAEAMITENDQYRKDVKFDVKATQN